MLKTCSGYVQTKTNLVSVPEDGGPRQIYLGTLPDYAASRCRRCALINGVTDDSPAEKAGLEGGDQIIEIAGREIGNVYDYSHALDGLKVGEPDRYLFVLRNRQTQDDADS